MVRGDNVAFLNYNGLKRYDKKTKEYIKDKISEASLNGGTVDLSTYATKEDLKNKVDKIEGKSLISDVEIERLKNVDNYDDTDIKNTLNKKANKTELFSGNYNDLTNKPTIPDTTNLATKSDLTTHIGNANIHVTSAEKSKWNAKLDNTDLKE